MLIVNKSLIILGIILLIIIIHYNSCINYNLLYKDITKLDIYNPYNNTLLLQSSIKSYSDQVLLFKNNSIVFTLYNPLSSNLIETMSITKSIVGLAILFLIQDNKINSINDKISQYIILWKNTDKENITIKDILNMSSYLKNDWEYQHYRKKTNNFLTMSLNIKTKTKTNTTPKTFEYNNFAIQILPTLVHILTSTHIDNYLNIKLFKPLNIKYYWYKDNYNTPFAPSGLHLNIDGLFKIGKLILNNGSYDNKIIIKPQLLDNFLNININHNDVEKSKTITNKYMKCSYGNLFWLCQDNESNIINNDNIVLWGYGGQYLIINKNKNVIGIRLKNLSYFIENNYDENNYFVKGSKHFFFDNFITYI
jgi:CubicO group peptidase (beta-lactamase class C family)